MNIIDIRSLLDKVESTILYLDKKEIYIAKYTSNTIYILSINVKNFYQTPIATWECTKCEFDNIGFRVYNKTLFIVYQENNNLIIKKISLEKKKIELEKSYLITGNKLDCQRILVVNENNIIIFFEELKFFSYDGFLCDLFEDKSYCINDRCLVDSITKDFRLYKIDGKYYICFEEIYMDDWEKEEIYIAVKKREIVVTDCFESLKVIEVNEFINSIKQDREQIPFDTVDMVSTYGWVRYLGMNRTHIFYRFKDFSTKIERIYSVSKIKLKRRLVMEIFDDKDKTYFYDVDNTRIFEITNNLTVKGILNSSISFNDIQGGKIEYIDSKNLLLSYDKLDELKLIRLNKNKGYETRVYTGKKCRIKNNIILY